MGVALVVIAAVAIATLVALVLLVLFEPALAYRVKAPGVPLDSDAFMRIVGATCDAQVERVGTFDVLHDGAGFYESELAAIAAARKSVHIEAFIFHPSSAGDRFVAALAERARRGVQVRVIVDAIGSFPTPDRYFDEIRSGGGHVAWYQPIRWYTLKRFNNRTHRELVIVDGAIGYIGGAGIGAHWLDPADGSLPWRDTMVRVTGSAVAGMQGAFIDNWLESTGDILADPELYLSQPERGLGNAVVVSSVPSPARGARARVLFQLLLASATKSIDINTPYFLPDGSARAELVRAAQRGVRVRIVMPGNANNHPVARRASRMYYGELIRGGVEIYEYQPGMIHAKILVVDATWSVVGSTNFDSRSFELNDEVNLAVNDRALANRLLEDFAADLASSRPISYAEWSARSWPQRFAGAVSLLLARQV
ncbi:MAG TPA: phospholipase D-like domain-containing protein [Casimicrobiaceae bacterium]